MRRHSSLMLLPAVLAIAALTVACTSIGRPEGGPRDETPPVFVRSIPAPGETNVDRKRIVAIFDENVQLDDAFSKVIVSPAQKQQPAISANGHRVTVEFRDTLLPNTTYTVDFADAIKDLNEGNILDGFALDFSTGDSIDQLRISGMVLEAETLEPAQGMLVGVYSNLADSAIRTLQMERIARTNQLGQFTIRNLKPGEYRIFAINDLNRDYHWDRSEDIAFYDTIISPYVENIEVTDTLRGSDGSDSLVVRPGKRYLPNDILLNFFNEKYSAQYLQDYKRPGRETITMTFAAPADTLPQVHIVKGGPEGLEISSWARLSANATLDSLEYWIEAPYLADADSLTLSVRYLRTDTNDALSWTTDTLRFYHRDTTKKKKGKKDKADEAPIDSLKADSIANANRQYLGIKYIGTTSIDLNRPLSIEISQPIDSIDPTAVHIEMQEDTLWNAVPGAALAVDSLKPLQKRTIDIAWRPGARYRLRIDSLGITGMYGIWNKAYSQEFTAKQLEDYSKLIFNITGTDSVAAIVELLNTSDKPVYRTTLAPGQTQATLEYIAPGEYYARLYLDRNGNGKWDTGSVESKTQPEEAYYYPKKLQLKKNWDVTQSWDIYELPVDAQKPYAIKKNRPKLKNGEKAPEEDEEEDEFGSPFGNRNNGTGSNRTGNNNGLRSNQRGGNIVH